MCKMLDFHLWLPHIEFTLGHHNLGPHYCMASLCCSWLHLIIVITPFLINVFAMSLYIGFAKWNDFLPRWFGVMNQPQNYFGWGVLCVHASKFFTCVLILLETELASFPGLPVSSFDCLQCAKMECKLSKTGNEEVPGTWLKQNCAWCFEVKPYQNAIFAWWVVIHSWGSGIIHQ